MNIQFVTRGLEKIGEMAYALKERIARVIREEALPLVQEVWAAVIAQRKGGRTPHPAESNFQYAAAVQEPQTIEYPVGGDPFYGRIAVSAPAALQAETDRPAWDMKPGLLAGPKARRGKKGRYNVIPLGFRGGGYVERPLGLSGREDYGVSPFRTVSDRSPANSWWYPARPGVHALEEAAEVATPQVVETIQKAI